MLKPHSLFQDWNMAQLAGMEDPEGPKKVWKLHKAVYGLKQPLKEWNGEINSTIEGVGFTADRCIYVRDTEDEDKKFYIVLYVDDLLLLCKMKSIMQEIKDFLSSKYQMKDLGDADHFLGIAMEQNQHDKCMCWKTCIIH